MAAISAELLEILVCPVSDCHGRLELRNDRLACVKCRREYRIEERWPVLIPEEAIVPGESDSGGGAGARN